MEADDFRRFHLADWPYEPWQRLTHETWEQYDREATIREDWYGPRGRRPAPAMNDWGLPPEARGGFSNLFRWICQQRFEEARELGYSGTFYDWQKQVRDAGRLAPDLDVRRSSV